MKRVFKWLQKYFIPHEGNEYKPHFLRHESMLAVFLVVIIVELGFLAQVFIVFDKTKFLAAVLPGVLTSLANDDREANNLPPLKHNDLLQKAAELKAHDMATLGYFAHTSPAGITPWHWLDVVGYNYTMAGENLAVNFYESGDVDQAWMNSPTHRANILKDGFTEIGIGVANGTYKGRDTIFVAQFFGTPLRVIPKPTPAPTTATPTPTTPAPKPAPKPTPRPTTTLTQNQTPTRAPLQVLGEQSSPTPSAVAEKASNQSRIKQLMQKIITSPLTSINYAYELVGIIIILALLMAIFIKSEIQHPAVIARGVALIAVIVFLFYTNVKLLHPDVEVPTDNLSASVIVAY
ncbi:MAG: CAP domain-containing protein [Patescibacteria group bacterium]